MSQSDKFVKFKKIFERSTSISIQRICLILEIKEKDLLYWIFTLPDKFGVTVYGNNIEFDQKRINEHIDELMADFEKMVQTQVEKLKSFAQNNDDQTKSWNEQSDQSHVELAKTEIIDFRGQEIFKLEADVLKEIEKSTGEIPIVNEIGYDTFGFQVKETSVKGLGLCGKSLTSQSIESIGNLTNLTVLKLPYNKLTSLPKSIGKLTNLTLLRLDFNQLTSLHVNIGKLTKLQKLYLNSNQLKSLPAESMGNLISLTELDLNNNILTSLPESLFNLTNLQRLYVHENQLISLPDNISNLTNLKHLYLQRNQFTSLQKNIGNLTKLTELDLWGNNLTTLPENISKLTKLTWLRLDDNPLTSLPGILKKWIERLEKKGCRIFQ